MTFLVLSDIHGRRDLADEALHLHRNADGVLFLGDGIRDLSLTACREGGRLFAGVRGNCDWFSVSQSEYFYSEELLLNLGEYTVMMMHGHTRNVKSGIDCAVRAAAERGALVLLYGHTHEPEERYLPEGYDADGLLLRRPMWVMNPGSLGAPKDGAHSYGLLQLRNRQILLSHGTL